MAQIMIKHVVYSKYKNVIINEEFSKYCLNINRDQLQQMYMGVLQMGCVVYI